MQPSSVSLREERSARPRQASEASPAQSHPPAQAQLPLASASRVLCPKDAPARCEQEAAHRLVVPHPQVPK